MKRGVKRRRANVKRKVNKVAQQKSTVAQGAVELLSRALEFMGEGDFSEGLCMCSFCGMGYYYSHDF
jgi:hypothetical protein